MRYIYRSIMSIVFLSSMAHADISKQERMKHFVKGSLKILFAGMNCVAMKYAAEGLYGEMRTIKLGRLLAGELRDDKMRWAHTESLVFAMSIPSLAYTAYKSFKSSIGSFKKVFKQVQTPKRERDDSYKELSLLHSSS